jgi:hypothetical protein
LLVGLKEAGAVRGVSTRGMPLPLAARDTAVAVIRAAFPDLVAERVGRTYVVLRMRPECELLQRLRALPVVDYLEPNGRTASWARRGADPDPSRDPISIK